MPSLPPPPGPAAGPAQPAATLATGQWRRPHCTACERPLARCLCRWVVPTANQVRLLVLQHPQEQHHAKGTVALLQRSLRHCQVVVGRAGRDGALFEPEALARWLAGDHPLGPPLQSWLLYPAAPAEPVDSALALPAPPLARPQALQLVLLDGSWRQSRQMLRAHPALQALPRWPLPDAAALAPAAYPLRRAHRPEQRASLDAACRALALLEGQPGRYAPLLAAFACWQQALLQRHRPTSAAGPTAAAGSDAALGPGQQRGHFGGHLRKA